MHIIVCGMDKDLDGCVNNPFPVRLTRHSSSRTYLARFVSEKRPRDRNKCKHHNMPPLKTIIIAGYIFEAHNIVCHEQLHRFILLDQ